MILQDWEGYNKDRETYDARVLHALSKGPQTEKELDIHFPSSEVRRACCEALRSEGKIYDSWDMTQPYDRPFRFYIR